MQISQSSLRVPQEYPIGTRHLPSISNLHAIVVRHVATRCFNSVNLLSNWNLWMHAKVVSMIHTLNSRIRITIQPPRELVQHLISLIDKNRVSIQEIESLEAEMDHQIEDLYEEKSLLEERFFALV